MAHYVYFPFQGGAMIVALSIMMFIGAVVFISTLTAITISDLRTIKQQKALKRHPYARCWRSRPFITVISTTHPIPAIPYKNTRQNKKTRKSPAPELVLSLQESSSPDRTRLITAVQQFNFDENIMAISFMPRLNLPRSTSELLGLYGIIAKLPFDSLRTACGVNPVQSSYLYRPHKDSLRITTYNYLTFTIKITNALLLIYASYAAAIWSQSELLLIYLLALSLWLIWALGRYPYFSLRKKIAFAVLAPMSFLYFVYQALAAPLRVSDERPHAQNAMIKI